MRPYMRPIVLAANEVYVGLLLADKRRHHFLCKLIRGITLIVKRINRGITSHVKRIRGITSHYAHSRHHFHVIAFHIVA
jgi:hypothetical protein